MNRPILLAAVAVTAMMAVACGPAATTTSPAASAAGGLVGPTWGLSESTVPALAAGSIDPASYTMEFLADGTFASQVDCNRVAGEYTSGAGGSLTITPGPSTMAACAEGSLGTAYLAALQSTTSQAVSEGRLVLTTGEGTLTFE